MSVDSAPGDSSNSQTYNRYAYVLNTPTVGTDPTGMFCSPACPDSGSSSTLAPPLGDVNLVGVDSGYFDGEDILEDPSPYRHQIYNCLILGDCSGPLWQTNSSSTSATASPTPAPTPTPSPAPDPSPAPPQSSTGSGNNPNPDPNHGLIPPCLINAGENFALHGGVDAIGLLPGVGGLSKAAIGAIGLTAGYAVNLMDLATPAGIGPTGLALTGTGTALFIAKTNKQVIAKVSADIAEAIPGVGTLFTLGQIAYDAYNAYNQACTAGGN